MQKSYINTPEGTRDRLFHECRDRRSAQSAITTLFKQRGYSEVVTPEVEYYDLFQRAGDPLPQEAMLKIIDRSGKIMVMRPDCTIPIARVAATKLAGSTFPQRLYYNQTIFRSDAAHVGLESEIAQCGIELIGAPGLRGDVEVLSMAVDTLEASGLENYHIELGHSDFFGALTRQLRLDQEVAETIRLYIQEKNFAGLDAYLDQLGKEKDLEAVRRLPRLFGEYPVLDEAEALLGEGEPKEIIEYLRSLYQVLSRAGRGDRIHFDLGMVSRLDYYTGVIFRGYARGAGRNVLSGGRYDQLLGYFGQERPATGFAIHVDDLADCLPHVTLAKTETVIHFSPDRLRDATALVVELPNGTAELSPYAEEAESLALAAQKGAKSLVVMTGQETREVTV